ncbi:Cyanovirin-N [Choiromyces venosus 120613-1]|uniref:Cyanovirin-N n=1 Tax=Choiromyces venosus 120613-1 TaxID=1336337 RepID=A0A3N4JS79_9PEZI|nr:Cyanovirin-N [Choiromyces venosus 120613-1]
MSYRDSSRNAVLINGGRTLQAECRKNDGSWVTSQIDLNSCIGNLNGFLGWDMQNFANTATEVRLEEDGRKLTCMVVKADGGHRERQGIHLDKIYNFDGVLTYRKSSLVPF